MWPKEAVSTMVVYIEVHCHQSLMKLAELNRIQLVWVTRYMGIDGNAIADGLAKQGSSLSLIGPEPALGIPAKFARWVIRDWTSRKHEEHWQSIHGQRQAKCFLKKKNQCKEGWGVARPEQKPAKNADRVATGHRHLKGHLSVLGLVQVLECDRCKQAFETA
jgi:hypothetical protein